MRRTLRAIAFCIFACCVSHTCFAVQIDAGWKIAGEGNWFSDGAWQIPTPAGVDEDDVPDFPNNGGFFEFDVDIPSSGSIVHLNDDKGVGIRVEISNLSIGEGAELSLENGRRVAISGSSGGLVEVGGLLRITGAGGLEFNSGSSGAEFRELTLTGDGMISMGAPLDGFFVLGSVPRLMKNQTHIQGVGFIEGTAVENSGLIEAIGGVLFIHPGNGPAGMANRLTNLGDGQMIASTGGRLQLAAGTFVNDGQIRADPNGVVQFGPGSIVTGSGPLATSGSGRLTVGTFATLDSANLTGILEVGDLDRLTLRGTIQNSGLVEMKGTNNLREILLDGPVTIEGPGSIQMSDTVYDSINSASGVPTLTNKSTIAGGGGLSGIMIDNRGTITGNLPGDPLVVRLLSGDRTVRNQRFLRGENGGVLNIVNTIVNNTGDASGILEAAANSHVDLVNSTLIGGVLRSDAADGAGQSPGSIRVFQAGTKFDLTEFSIRNEGLVEIVDGATLTLVGRDSLGFEQLDNHGTILLNAASDNTASTTTLTLVDGDVALAGSGILLLSDSDKNRITRGVQPDSQWTLTNRGAHTIRGSGNIGAGNLHLVNQGLIENRASNHPLTIHVADNSENSGVIRAADGGQVKVRMPGLLFVFPPQGGRIEAVDASTVELIGASAPNNSGGVFNQHILATNKSIVYFDRFYLLSTILESDVEGDPGATARFVNRSLMNMRGVRLNGTIVGAPSSVLELDSGNRLDEGRIILGATTAPASIKVLFSATRGGNLDGTGLIDLGRSGVITSDRMPGNLGDLTINGEIVVRGAGQITNVPLILADGATLDGGIDDLPMSISLPDSPDLEPGEPNVAEYFGLILLDGSSIRTRGEGGIVVSNGRILNEGGEVVIPAGSRLINTFVPPLLNDSEVTYRQGAGKTTVDGTLQAIKVVIEGGEFEGQANVKGNLVDLRGDAVLKPGKSSGVMLFETDFIQSENAILEIELGGLIPGEEYDQLFVTGHADFGGILRVMLLPGLEAPQGSTFDFFVGDDFDVMFSDVQMPLSPLGEPLLDWRAGPGGLQLVALRDLSVPVPEPSGAALLVLGGMLASLGRRISRC